MNKLMAGLMLLILAFGVLGVSLSEETIKNRLENLDNKITEISNERYGKAFKLTEVSKEREYLNKQLEQITGNKKDVFNLEKHTAKVKECRRLYPQGYSKTFDAGGALIKCRRKGVSTNTKVITR